MKSSVHILIIILLVGFICFVFIRCSDGTKNSNYLHRAEDIVINDPQEALIFLDSIISPEKLPKSDYMKYLVLKTQARYKNYEDITQDTLIFNAVKYYNKQINDPYEKAIANLYTGCVYCEKGIHSEAMEYFLKANNNAEKTKDTELKALIKTETGKLYYEKNLPDSAITYYKEALKLYTRVDSTEKQQSQLMHMIAINYSIKDAFDEALYYNNKALVLSKQLNDTSSQVRIMNSLGVIYREIGNYKASKTILFETLKYNNLASSLKENVYLNIAKNYYNEDKVDSAFYYIKLIHPAIEKRDNYFKLSFHQTLYKILIKIGKYAEAIEHQSLYHDYRIEITDKEKSDALVQAEKEYQLAEKKKQLILSQLQTQIFLSIALGSFLLLAIAVIVIIITRNIHKRTIQKNKLLDTQLSNILFVNDLYKYIMNESNSFEKDIESLTLSYSLKDESKGYSQIQNMLKNMKKETKRSLRNASLEFLKNKSISNEVISSLNASDMLLISLIQCNYDFKDISIILDVNPHALHMRKQRLKERLKKGGISDREIDKIIP